MKMALILLDPRYNGIFDLSLHRVRFNQLLYSYILHYKIEGGVKWSFHGLNGN